ncbi:MAG TPA: hypothetical protein DEG71_03210 [Clostridiales bacterium]|nr:hypothetical protein [Clostridiales bacterium]
MKNIVPKITGDILCFGFRYYLDSFQVLGFGEVIREKLYLKNRTEQKKYNFLNDLRWKLEECGFLADILYSSEYDEYPSVIQIGLPLSSLFELKLNWENINEYLCMRLKETLLDIYPELEGEFDFKYNYPDISFLV